MEEPKHLQNITQKTKFDTNVDYNAITSSDFEKLQLDFKEFKQNYVTLESKYDTINQNVNSVIGITSNQLTYGGYFITALFAFAAFMQFFIYRTQKAAIKAAKLKIQDKAIEEIKKINIELSKGVLKNNDIKNKIIKTIIEADDFALATKQIIKSSFAEIANENNYTNVPIDLTTGDFETN